MAGTKAKRGKKGESKQETPPTTCDPLAHPMRVRILEVVNEQPMSPVQFLDEGFSPRTFKTKSAGVSYISYHFRKLAEAGCIKVGKTVARRGATEHIYTGCSRVFYSDKDFEALPLEQRKQLSQTSFQGLVARTDGAIRSGTFDKRTDRHLTWRAADFDEQGWDELMAVLGEAFEKAEQVRTDTALRMAEKQLEAAEAEEVAPPKRIPATFGILGFESPPPKLRY